MIFDTLDLVNYCQYRSFHIDFQYGLAGFFGRNGVGKSNLITSPYFAITGKTPPEVNRGDLLRWGSTSGHTEIVMKESVHTIKLKRNLHSSTVKLTDDNGLELRNADANAFIENLLGMPFDIFWETCWIPQGSLTSLLTKPHAQRLAFFQKVAGVKEAETIRGIIQEKGLAKIPLFPDRSSEIQELTQTLTTSAEELEKLDTSKETLEALYAQYKEFIDRTAALLSMPTADQREGQVTAAQGQLMLAEQALADFMEGNLITEVPEPELVPDPDTYEAYQAMDKLDEELKEYSSELEGLIEGEPESDEAEVTVAMLDGLIMEMSNVCKLIDDKECPTCHKEYTTDDVGLDVDPHEHRDALIGRRAVVVAHTEWQHRLGTVKQYITDNEDAVKYLNDEHDLNDYSPEVFEQRRDAWIEYNSFLRDKNTHSEHIKLLEQSIANKKAELATVEAKPYATEDRIKEAQEFKVNYDEINEKRTEVLEQIASITARAEELKNTHTRFANEQTRREETDKVRTLFERAREVLHRDNLPKVVMQRMRLGLNNIMSNYLSLFDTNFTAYIDENFDFLCNFEERPDVPARLLSGGQQVALSIAFRFALSDLFANDVPLLVLDEPTVWLDDANKQKVGEVLGKAREVTEKGVFVLIATHEEMLMPSFSRVIDVSPQSR